MPMLETLELRFCVDVDSVTLVYSKLENLSILSSYTITFECFNVNPIITIIKHLYLNRTSLDVDETSRVRERSCYLSSEFDSNIEVSEIQGIEYGNVLNKSPSLFSFSKLERMIIEKCEKLGNATNFKENFKEFCNLKTKTKKRTTAQKSKNGHKIQQLHHCRKVQIAKLSRVD
ncbi:hypothetical protein H5410_026002 [Solanum commersonii]|uniref:Uncharacterized protein n=1 Tax=Solanum commersonii TaxID=4109 RepID=A0A9J5Z070_SOLCO|nr:hypothetical protein H5410_026002 [Solanum commersonii]